MNPVTGLELVQHTPEPKEAQAFSAPVWIALMQALLGFEAEYPPHWYK
jgi:hypothetical protein